MATEESPIIPIINDNIVPASFSFSISAGASNITEIAITVLDAYGKAITDIVTFNVWLAATAITGAGLHATTPSGDFAVKTSGGHWLADLTAKFMMKVQTLATGICTVQITDTAKTAFHVAAGIEGNNVVSVSRILATGGYG